MSNNTNYSMEVIRYIIPPDEHESFEETYKQAGKYLKESEFCLGYQLINGNEEPDNYIVLIRWNSMEEHLNGFRKSADFMPFFNLVKPFLNNIQEMKHYDIVIDNWIK